MPRFVLIDGIRMLHHEPGEVVNTRCGYCGTPYSYIKPQPGQISKTACPKVAEPGQKQCNTVWIHYTARDMGT